MTAVETKRTFLWRDDYLAEDAIHSASPNARLTVASISLDSVDWDRSSNNGARMFQAFDEDAIEDYMRCFESGSVFPRPVVSLGRNGYVILGGNQRCMAIRRIAEKAGEPLSAYEIEASVVDGTTGHENDAILRMLNNSNGYTPSKSERIQHALHLVSVDGYSVDDAARMMHVGSDLVRTHIKSEETRATIARDGVDSSKFSISALTSLSRVKDKRIRNSIAKVVEVHQPTASAVNDIVASVVNGTSEYRRLKAVERWSDGVVKSKTAVGTKAGSRNPLRDKFYRKLNELYRFLEEGNSGYPFTSLDQLSCTEDEDVPQLRPIVSIVKARLDIITGGN